MMGHGEWMWLSKLRSEIDPDPRKLHVEQIELKAKLEFIEDMVNLKLEDIQDDEQQGNAVAPMRSAKHR